MKKFLALVVFGLGMLYSPRAASQQISSSVPPDVSHMSHKERKAFRKIGGTDASVTQYMGNAAKGIGGTISHKGHMLVEFYSQLFAHGQRTPIMRRPDEYGMKYEDVTFPSMDGVQLEGWYIPAANSKKLLIINHPMTCNRYGYPGHLPQWSIYWGGFEVNFLPELKHLHDAGYNILTYDLRNHGLSASANGGISGLGLLECRDVVGSVRYVKSRPDLAGMEVGLYSRCMGSISTAVAMSKWPEEFKDINLKAALFLNIVTGKTFVEKAAKLVGENPERVVARVNKRLHELSGFYLDEETPVPYIKDVKIPTMLVQIRRDFLIHGEDDGMKIFNALGAKDKELFWIEDSNQRFYAYNYFGQHPEKLVGWFDKHMN